MKLHGLIKRILFASWLGMVIVYSVMAEPVVHRNYYSIQTISGSFETVKGVWDKSQDLPFARIEKHADRYRLRIGFWQNRKDAEDQLMMVRKRFPSAFVIATDYEPGRIMLDWSGNFGEMKEKLSVVDKHPDQQRSGGIAKPLTMPSNIVSAMSNESNIVRQEENLSEATVTYQKPIDAPQYNRKPRQDTSEPDVAAAPSLAAEEEHIAKPVKLRQATKPDERPLWRLLQDEQFELLQAEIDRLRLKYKKWQPPQELLDLMRQGSLRKAVDLAIRNEDKVALVRLGELNSEAFSCEHLDWAWALAEVQAELKHAEALSLTLHRLIPGCEENDRLATIYKAKSWLSENQWEALLDREAQAPRSAEGESKFRRLRYDERMEKFLAAYQAHDKNSFRLLLQQLGNEIEHYRDADAALLSGWHFLNEQETGDATYWFNKALAWKPEMSDAYQGLALSAMQEKRFMDAKRLVKMLPDSDEKKEVLLRDIAAATKPKPRFLGMVGGETNTGTTYSAAYVGLIAPIHSRLGGLGNGFVQRWWADRLTYSYADNGRDIQAEQLGIEGSLGYQKSGPWGGWAMFAGAVYRDTSFSPDVQNNPARGGFVRGRIQIEGERILNQDWRVNVNANYVTGQNSYWARGRLLYNVNRRLLVGPEFVVLGDPNFQIRQYGATVMGLNFLSIADVAVRGGAREAHDGTTFYLGLELARPF